MRVKVEYEGGDMEVIDVTATTTLTAIAAAVKMVTRKQKATSVYRRVSSMTIVPTSVNHTDDRSGIPSGWAERPMGAG